MSLNLNQLDGAIGFRLTGVDPDDLSGFSVARAGDVNGDGIDDVIIGAPHADRNGAGNAGVCYVVFGTALGFPERLDLATLDGTDGFRLDGIDADDQSGATAAGAGDVNDDGIDDLIVGAFNADGNGIPDSGESYIVFGSPTGFGSTLDLATLDGTNGFRVNGYIDGGAAGSVASAGDINGDGIDDVIVGAPGPYFSGGTGHAYVVFGSSAGFDANLDLGALDRSNGFRLLGVAPADFTGRSVGSAGDVNGDGLEDVVISAMYADPNGNDRAGEAYIVFGSSTGFEEILDLSMLDGMNGFRVEGLAPNDLTGLTVAAAGDVNGDGIDDVVVGAVGVDGDVGYDAGGSYVVFGSGTGFAESVSLSDLDGSNGFRIEGAGPGDETGWSVAGAGDINGDGLDDLIIGAPSRFDNEAGRTFVVFGSAEGFDASLNLADLDGSRGIQLDGVNIDDESGYSASGAGDVNGDGIDDLIIGARYADPNGIPNTGESYVIFGSTQLGGPNDAPVAQDDALDVRPTDRVDLAADNGNGADRDPDFDDLTITMIDGVAVLPGDAVTLASGLVVTFVGGSEVRFDAPDAALGARLSDSFDYEISDGRGGVDTATATVEFTRDAFDLASLDGTNGFSLKGIDNFDNSGLAVAGAGDVNGDGFDDLVVGALGADGDGIYDTGENYVVFGSAAEFAAALDLAGLDGSNGFRLDGSDNDDRSGSSVARAGDVNGDGIDDLIVGAPGGDPRRTGNAGESYVVFGSRAGFDATFDLSSLDGSDGFRLDGISRDDGSGASVASAGDVNGDGIDDLVIGAPGADGDGLYSTGESYVIFGSRTGFAASFDLAALDGDNGFRLDGIDADDESGTSVAAAGDVNGDGFGDIIIGAPGADPGREGRTGESYVVFGGSTGFSPAIDLGALDGTDGFRIDGVARDDFSGASVATAGDINGDGIDDLIVGARNADVDGRADAGASYVVFGTDTGFAARLDLSALDGTNGFRLTGTDAYDESGFSVAGAGDFNGDGIDDLIVGAHRADVGTNADAGQSYVVFGTDAGFDASLDLSSLDGANGFRLVGVDAFDESGSAVAGAGDVNGDGYDDLIIGARFADPDGAYDAGESYLVFGFAPAPAQTHFFGGPHSNVLVGTAADEALHPGGGRDRMTTGNGTDTIFFDDRPGKQDALTITDLDRLADEFELGGASLARTIAREDRTVLHLEGADRDKIVLLGLSEVPVDLLL